MLAMVGLVQKCLEKRRVLVDSAMMHQLIRFLTSYLAQMKSDVVRQDKEEDSSEEDKLSSLILLFCSRKKEERGER